MARQSRIDQQWTVGELSPFLHGRTDLAQYGQGAKALTNWIPLPHGAITRRGGSEFVSAVKNSAYKPRLLDFIFGVEQAYLIEMGNTGSGYFRFYRDQGIIESSPDTPYELAHTYAESELFSIKYAQSADVMYLAHGDHPARKLTRTAHTSWTLTDVDFQDGPYLDIDISGATMSLSATSGTVTVTASAAAFAASDTSGTGGTGLYDRLLRILDGSTWYWLKITGYTSTTVVTAAIQNGATFAGTGPFASWRLGAWASTTSFPAAVTFFEGRLCFGGGSDQPQTFWMSESNSFEGFTPGTNDSDGVTATIAAKQVNVIRWLAGVTDLVIGTSGGVWRTRRPSSGPITPSNLAVKQVSTQGCADHDPIIVDEKALYVERFGQATNAGRKLREFRYNVDADEYRSADLSILSDHLTKPGIKDVGWQQQPHPTCWTAMSDGTMAALTYNPAELVVAWAPQAIDGAVESVAAIPGADGDEVWLLVARTINGATARHVEFLHPKDPENLNYIDSFIEGTSGSPTATWTGYDHLEGETLKVVADGAPVADVTVASGTITLAAAVSTIVAGLGYQSRVKSMSPEIASARGTMQGRPKSIYRMVIRCLDTLGLKVKSGDAVTTPDELVFRKVSDSVQQPIPPFSGDVEVEPPSDFDLDGSYEITVDDPVPATILAVVPSYEAHD